MVRTIKINFLELRKLPRGFQSPESVYSRKTLISVTTENCVAFKSPPLQLQVVLKRITCIPGIERTGWTSF
jgi:hypothetical protein